MKWGKVKGGEGRGLIGDMGGGGGGGGGIYNSRGNINQPQALAERNRCCFESLGQGGEGTAQEGGMVTGPDETYLSIKAKRGEREGEEGRKKKKRTKGKMERGRGPVWGEAGGNAKEGGDQKERTNPWGKNFYRGVLHSAEPPVRSMVPE